MSECAVCGSGDVFVLPAFEALPRVTSDCRPFPAGGELGVCQVCHAVQKPADARWQDEASAIYSRYDIFRQGGGAEQRVFDQKTGGSLLRSEAVLRRLNDWQPLAETGSVLDVGCGNGPTIRAMAKIAPGWALYGHEISDTNLPILQAVPGFQKLYTGELADIGEKFDLIILSHSLEHIPKPVEALAALRELLAPNGRLLVEVPNLRQNVYDLVVADHRSHFDKETLGAAARRAGFEHVVVFDDWAFKELTMVASNDALPNTVQTSTSSIFAQAEIAKRIKWLSAVVEAATQASRVPGPFGLFGTAIAATWLFGPLEKEVSFFVDEDVNRVGQQHEGRPILPPGEAPADATIFVPLVPSVAAAVAERLRVHGRTAKLPPDQPFDSAAR